MYKIKITALRRANYRDLQTLYENPIDDACCINEGTSWLCQEARKPEGLCESAWETLRPFVEALARGEGDFYNGWMRNPYSALISCNDGFRPVSFLLERQC